jgi:hypothetical protein
MQDEKKMKKKLKYIEEYELNWGAVWFRIL